MVCNGFSMSKRGRRRKRGMCKIVFPLSLFLFLFSRLFPLLNYTSTSTVYTSTCLASNPAHRPAAAIRKRMTASRGPVGAIVSPSLHPPLSRDVRRTTAKVGERRDSVISTLGDLAAEGESQRQRLNDLSIFSYPLHFFSLFPSLSLPLSLSIRYGRPRG